ncbi:MAG: ribosome maturation factor RimP [Lachnospiraceae bacterium]|nr:ribosome maturation factor RimP [Lachnospiraceae bacterium]
MKKREIEQRAEMLLTAIAIENGVSVYDVEYVREAGEYFLRCFIDREGGVTIDHCVAVNHAMSKALDEEDFIDEAYTLEVSSPGLGRSLTKDRHLEHEIGSEIDVKLYQAKDGQKVFCGILTAFDRDSITIAVDDAPVTFRRKDIASIKLTIDF